MSGLLRIARALEAFVRPSFGLSLVAVCRREAS
jgi:hypothetical protein